MNLGKENQQTCGERSRTISQVAQFALTDISLFSVVSVAKIF